MRLSRVLLIPMVLVLIAAGTMPDPEELVRQGNAAFERQEYEVALKLYGQAEAIILTPDTVAFNKAAALYRLRRYRDAQLHYEYCLDEADTARRAFVFYNLGNCLLQQAQASENLAQFREAVDRFERCLREPNIEAGLAENARHNLELAKLLWLAARLARPNQEEKPPEGDPKQDPPPPSKSGAEQKIEDGGDPMAGSSPKPIDDKKGSKMETKRDKQKPIETDVNAPGRGPPPPPKDEKELDALRPDDAVRNLELAAEKIRKERNIYRQRSAPAPLGGVPDW
jgi:tetratricopeptide (TPR) repeat protein